MNAVPGMTTEFFFEPTITTEQMRQITKNDKFSYVLLCNKICGVAHYNMKMNVVAEEADQFNKWVTGQSLVFPKPAAPAAAAPSATATATSANH